MNRLFILCLLVILIASKSQYRAINNSCTTTSCSFTLNYTGTDTYYKVPKNPIVKNLVVVFQALTYYDCTIKIIDANSKRFQVPQGGSFPQDPIKNFSFPIAAAAYTFSYTLQPFDFKITRKSNNYTIFQTYTSEMIYSSYYLQVGTELGSDFIYGLGERFTSNFRVKDGKWTIFNRDHPFQIDYGTGYQTYGYFPYYLNREKDNYFHLTYFRNSNAMDVIKQKRNQNTALTFKTIGGIIDLRFFLGQFASPNNTIYKMNEYAGFSNLPPFWALGFHQCRWGYEDSSQLLQVLSNYEYYGIPLDTIWSDIDYMLDFQDFTIDQDNFPLSDMKKIQQNYRYIPIIDAGIKIEGIAYDEGIKRKVFVNDPEGKPFVGAVWPGDTTFVDFFHPNATQYWGDMLNLLYQKVPFDGVWLDMNEISNFCNGPCTVPITETIFDYARDLPYHPGSSNIQDSTIPLNCTHYNGILQADVHVFHALLQNKATNDFLKSKGVRPFIVSRSSTIGSSKYGNHWTGDNAATWQFLKGSISNIFNSHLNGFKIVGQDICGFAGNTTQQLCARWYQLGSLYPFSRSHNAYGAMSQQPYALGEVVLQSATKAIKLRYSLLKLFYSLMMKNSFSFLWQPLFFSYPLDQKCYGDEISNSQFIIGGLLMITPILQEKAMSRTVYFPGSSWVDLFTGKKYIGGKQYLIQCNLIDNIPIFLNQSSTVLLQNTQGVRNTKQLTNKFQLYASFSFISDSQGKSFYQSTGGLILSFNDLNDEQKVQKCDNSKKCFYNLYLMLTIQENKKTLSIFTYYQQPISYNEQIIIQALNIYYQNQTIKFKPSKNIIISSIGQQIIDIPISQDQILTIDSTE